MELNLQEHLDITEQLSTFWDLVPMGWHFSRASVHVSDLWRQGFPTNRAAPHRDMRARYLAWVDE